MACYPRAVRWLFSAAGTPLAEPVRILNMRTDTPEAILDATGLAATAPGEPR